MNTMSFNIKGGGNMVKRRRLSHIIQSCKVDMCFIQESKLSELNDNLAASMWGNKEVEWSEFGADGEARGTIIMWRKTVMKLNFSFRGNSFVGVNVEWKSDEYNFANVYSSCNFADKRSLHSSLIKKKTNGGGGDWIVGGDFNSIISMKERKGPDGRSRNKEMIEFKNFIEEM